jgi:hypothetical protein
MGPILQWHLGGGANGIQHFMDHLMDPLAALMKALGTPDVTPELKKTIAEGVSQMAEAIWSNNSRRKKTGCWSTSCRGEAYRGKVFPKLQ